MSDLFPRIVDIDGELFVVTWRHIMVYGTMYVFLCIIVILALYAGYRKGVRVGISQAESIWERDWGLECGEAKALTATVAEIIASKSAKEASGRC